MTIDYGPFDAGTGANRTEDFWRSFFRHLTGSAVIDGERSEFAVAERGAGANMSVDVAAGTAFIRGHWIDSDATENKAISAADATNPRKDRVVLRADFTANTMSIEVLTGTPAGSPTVPSLTQSSSRWEIAIATVDVAASASSIVDANITDERTLQTFPTFDVSTAPANNDVWKYNSATGLWTPDTASALPAFYDAAELVAYSGSPTLGDAGATYNRGWLLDSATSESAGGRIRIPTGVTSVNIAVLWANAGAGSGDVAFRAVTNAFGTGDTLSPSGGSTVTATAGAQAVVMSTTLVSSLAVTEDEYLTFAAERQGAVGGDTLGNDIAVIGILITEA